MHMQATVGAKAKDFWRLGDMQILSQRNEGSSEKNDPSFCITVCRGVFHYHSIRDRVYLSNLKCGELGTPVSRKKH